MPYPLVQIVVALLIAGVALWVLQQFTPPIDATLSKFARVIIIAVVAVWAIYLLAGLFSGGAPGPYFYRR